MGSTVDIKCWECRDRVPLADNGAEGFQCLTCGRTYEFWLCTSCESVNQIWPAAAGGEAACQWCLSRIRLRRFGPGERSTAEDWYAELEDRGLLDAGHDEVLISGFRLVGGSGINIESRAICSVLTLPDAVDVRAEVGGIGVASIPYGEITDIDIAGSARTGSAGVIGGGFGLQGAAEGMLVASIINSLTRKTTIDTGLAIATAQGELLLNHDGVPARELRRRLSPLFTRVNAARHRGGGERTIDDPASQLERLAQLREEGLLTDEEFEAARHHQVQRLIGGDSR